MNELRKPFILAGVVMVALLILGFGGMYVLQKSQDKEDSRVIDDSTYVTEFTYKTKQAEYKVVNRNESGERWLLKDNTLEKVLLSVSTRPTPQLELPKTTEAVDVLKEYPDTEGYSYEIALEDTSKYLNYLKSQGYKVETQVNASTYIEVILNGQGTRKRLIAQRNLLIIGDLLDSTKLPEIEDYLQTYSKTGGSKDE